jgi:hypothetical protein
MLHVISPIPSSCVYLYLGGSRIHSHAPASPIERMCFCSWSLQLLHVSLAVAISLYASVTPQAKKLSLGEFNFLCSFYAIIQESMSSLVLYGTCPKQCPDIVTRSMQLWMINPADGKMWKLEPSWGNMHTWSVDLPIWCIMQVDVPWYKTSMHLFYRRVENLVEHDAAAKITWDVECLNQSNYHYAVTLP